MLFLGVLYYDQEFGKLFQMVKKMKIKEGFMILNYYNLQVTC
jgi:hypothetical protein